MARAAKRPRRILPRPISDLAGNSPDSARKLMDVSRLARLGWQAEIALRDGIAQTYEWYLQQDQASLRSK